MGVEDVGGCSGRQVVGQLNERQSAVETLTLLLEAALGRASSLVALLLLHGFFLFTVLFIRLQKLHGILLLLVLSSHFALWLHLGGCRSTLLTGLPVLCQPLCHSLVVHRLGLPQALLWFLPLQTGERMLGAVTIGMCEPIATSFLRADKGFLPGVQPLVCLQLTTLDKGLPTVWIVTQIRPLSCVCPLVSLKRLLSGKHSVTDVTANAAGGGLPLTYKLPDGVSPWTPSTDTISDLVR